MTDQSSETILWARSGAMALTGRSDGPPCVAPGRAASTVRTALDRIHSVHVTAPLPGVELLGERAAAAGLARRAPWSCGGAFRVVRTADGHLGISLPRDTDLAAVPALVEAPVEEPWSAVEAWAATCPTRAAEERAHLLGLACAAVEIGDAVASRPPALVTSYGRRTHADRPLVVDFSSLWAGPLCAHLLSLCGANVVKVESTQRLDGARRGPRAFFDLLHAGHLSASVDFTSARDMSRLRDLVLRADLVIEASRARALRRVGLVAEDVVAAGTSWLSITAYGRDQDVIGFGDDVAAGAGFVTPEYFPCGDALADPLAGVTSAAYATEALATDEALLIDLSMHAVAARAAKGDVESHEVTLRGDTWWVECDAGAVPVAAPRLRPAIGSASPPGRDTEEVFG